MKLQLQSKELFERARINAFKYMDNIEDMRVFPDQKSLDKLEHFDEPLQAKSADPFKVLQSLQHFGSPATTAQTGGRYFGFVDGGAVPVSLAAKWMSDVWDQCGGLYVISPINGKLEMVCEAWLKQVLGLPDSTVAGFVSGTSMANLSALCAARYHLLKKLDWDLNANGMYGAPPIRILAHEQVHASVKKTLAILGFGSQNIEWLPSDDQGRLELDSLPKMDNSCLVLLQAGNANTGAFDNIDWVCDQANAAGAWVHVDGAFGLWAAACKELRHLTKGLDKADSWAVDGHKTLNTPYDSGIVLCKHPDSLITALQANGEYIIYSDRDPMLYGPEMSKRSRAIELWATMKYLGTQGIDDMVMGFHKHALRLASNLEQLGYRVLNDVVFNQVLIDCDDPDKTEAAVAYIQASGKAWLGGTTWKGYPAIRISICSWMTTDEDIDILIDLFADFKKVET